MKYNNKTLKALFCATLFAAGLYYTRADIGGPYSAICYPGGPTGSPHEVICRNCYPDCEDEETISCECEDTDYGSFQDYDDPGNSNTWNCYTSGNCAYCTPTDPQKNGCTWTHHAFTCSGNFLGLGTNPLYGSGYEVDDQSTNSGSLYQNVQSWCP
jgi:hypothetical protein